MAWFKKERKPRTPVRERREIPADAWIKCDRCDHLMLREKFERSLRVCPECGHHARYTAEGYIELLSDEDKKVCELFDVWKEKSMYGRKYMGVERSTFLIDGGGVLRQEWRKVKVPGHAGAVLEAAKAL